MMLGLWRCTFDAGGATHPAVVVFNMVDPVILLVGEHLLSRDELDARYPGATDPECFGEHVLAPVAVDDEQWAALSGAEKAALVHRTLDAHEVRS